MMQFVGLIFVGIALGALTSAIQKHKKDINN
jgi:hypothetical protein